MAERADRGNKDEPIGRKGTAFAGGGIPDDSASRGDRGAAGEAIGADAGAGAAQEVDQEAPSDPILGEKPKRRGRKPGTKLGPRKAKGEKLDLDLLTRQLVGIHVMLAAATGTPELAIQESEGKELSSAIGDLVAQYEWAIDPRMVAWANLIGVCSAIYVPRALAIRMRTAQTREDELSRRRAQAEATLAH